MSIKLTDNYRMQSIKLTITSHPELVRGINIISIPFVATTLLSYSSCLGHWRCVVLMDLLWDIHIIVGEMYIYIYSWMMGGFRLQFINVLQIS